MPNINLYSIEEDKVEDLRKSLEYNNKIKDKIILDSDGEICDFRFTFYMEKGEQTQEPLDWIWVLNEFNIDMIKKYRSPRAVLLVEKSTQTKNTVYAITYGSSYFKVDKYCDRDFGFRFASRMKYSNVKTTTLTAPSLSRNKTVNTYINYNNLDFNSGESFSKLRVNAELPEDFTLFKPSIDIGNSIRFVTESGNLEGIMDIIIYVENIFKIPDDEVIYKIPLFKAVKDENMLSDLMDNLSEAIEDELAKERGSSLFNIPELEVIGSDTLLARNDVLYNLKYKSNKKEINELSRETLRKFCQENEINNSISFFEIYIIKQVSDNTVIKKKLIEFVEYTDDHQMCILTGGRWYLFNNDYLTYLNDSVDEIDVIYNNTYDFSDTIHDKFIEDKYLEEASLPKYLDKEKSYINTSLKKKYYAERCFNILREIDGDYINYDRVDTDLGYEKMDLYEIASKTMFAVKIGSSSAGLCYAVDQSLISLKKYKHKEIEGMHTIEKVGLWFILERIGHLDRNQEDRLLLSSLNMLMLKNRIDQWKKEVRAHGLKPIIYVNYRSK